MATTQEWVAASRPRTLGAAAAPVLIGSGAAAQLDSFRPVHALLALGLALALQVGVNYANDYSDGIRGTDLNRVGPVRLTAAGLATPKSVKLAAVSSFRVGALFGLLLVLLSGHWWLLGVGAISIVAAWFYTGGKRPYGYSGLGEVMVFVFFGLVATLGTTYTQADRLSWPALFGAIGSGLIACALLMINNIRDIPTDQVVGKHTLAVRLGERKARWAYGLMVLLPVPIALLSAPANPWTLFMMVLALPAVLLASAVAFGPRGRGLVFILGMTGAYHLSYGILLGLLLAI